MKHTFEGIIVTKGGSVEFRGGESDSGFDTVSMGRGGSGGYIVRVGQIGIYTTDFGGIWD